MRRVEYNDGEGLVHTDLNAAQALLGRNLGRVLERRLWGDDTTTLRLCSGAMFTLGGTGLRQVTLTAGTYLQPIAAPATEDDPNFRLGNYPGATYTLDAPTPTFYRRDLIQVKLETEAAGSNESRDVEDAASRTVTSQSVPKRRFSTVTMTVKKGTDQASEALADSNEPTPDAGYAKAFSVLVPPTGNVDEDKVWDWHSPIGQGRWHLDPPTTSFGGTSIEVDTNPGSSQYEVVPGADANVGWIAPTVGDIGIRLIQAQGNFTTKGSTTYLVYFRDQSGNFAYAWHDDVAEGLAGANRTKNFDDKPLWATGLRNRKPLTYTATTTPLKFVWRVNDPSDYNYFYGMFVQYVGS